MTRQPERNETNAARQARLRERRKAKGVQAGIYLAVTGSGGQPGTPGRGTLAWNSREAVT